METITLDHAKKYLLYHQGLLGRPRFLAKAGIVDYIKRAGCIQYDPVDVCGRNADLTLQSRIADYDKTMLDDLLYRDRVLVDGFDKNMAIYHVDDFYHLSTNRQRFVNRHHWYETIKDYIEPVTSVIRQRPFVSSADFDAIAHQKTGWGPASLHGKILDYLLASGQIIIHHKEGTRRYFAWREHYFPKDKPVFSTMEQEYMWYVKRRIGAIGLMWNKRSDAWLGIPGFKTADRQRAFTSLVEQGDIVPLKINGLNDVFYIERSSLDDLRASEHQEPGDRIEFIAPLDPLIWDRKLIAALFEFNYTWEIYTPKDKRLYGRYTLPIIQGLDFVGRVQFGKNDGQLLVENVWVETSKHLDREQLEARVIQFAVFNALEYGGYHES